MSKFFEGYIIDEIDDQISQYGYCYFEFKKNKSRWTLFFSGSEYPYRVTSDYYEELESIISEDEVVVDNSISIIKSFFSELRNLRILEDSIRVSKARIFCIVCNKKTVFHEIKSIESLIQSVSDITFPNI